MFFALDESSSARNIPGGGPGCVGKFIFLCLHGTKIWPPLLLNYFARMGNKTFMFYLIMEAQETAKTFLFMGWRETSRQLTHLQPLCDGGGQTDILPLCNKRDSRRGILWSSYMPQRSPPSASHPPSLSWDQEAATFIGKLTRSFLRLELVLHS